MNILLTICARGGSKGIPGKNIKPVGGKPLIAYTIDIAKKFADKYNCPIVLSTDSEEIREVGRAFGLETEYERPDYLANDTCAKPDAIADAMLWAEEKYGVKYDMVLDLDVTSPIRTLKDVEECVRIISENEEALTIFSVNPCARNPYFNMVEQKRDGFYREVIEATYTTRQASPKVYDINGSIYVYRREALMVKPTKAVTQRTLVYVMDHICFDLDEPSDYDYLAYLLDTGKLQIV